MSEISWFPVARDEDLDEYAREIWQKCDERIGFVPNVFRAYAWRGERFQRWLKYFNHVTHPSDTLGAAEREMIAVAVSMENRCLYCLVAHGCELREVLGHPILGETITLDWRRAPLSDRHRAMLAYAVKVANEPRECTRADIDALDAHGFSDEDVWDIAEIASLYSATNRMAMAAGFIPNDCYHGAARGPSGSRDDG
ncbi:MAG: peroxidase-related enzyme [Egibacteraceae bacterium]